MVLILSVNSHNGYAICSRKMFFVSGEFIRAKGRRILKDFYKYLPNGRIIQLIFSNGWFGSFKKKNKFKSWKRHGESGESDTTGITFKLPELRSRLAQCRSCNIFNAEECGLYYPQPSTVTIGPARLRGRKNRKYHVTFLFCVNANDIEKLPPMVVGSAENPRCFLGVAAHGMGFDYDFSKKS